LAKFLQTCSRSHANGNRHGSFKKRTRCQLFGLFAHKGKQLLLNQVSFGDRYQTHLHAEQAADVEVFACLRHDTFVCRNHKRDGINAMDTGEHVFHETLVAGHVNKTDPHVSKIKVRETKIDGYAAPLLFW
jgi:hypothetical protein